MSTRPGPLQPSDLPSAPDVVTLYVRDTTRNAIKTIRFGLLAEADESLSLRNIWRLDQSEELVDVATDARYADHLRHLQAHYQLEDLQTPSSRVRTQSPARQAAVQHLVKQIPTSHMHALTLREQQVAALLGRGFTYYEIAVALGVSAIHARQIGMGLRKRLNLPSQDRSASLLKGLHAAGWIPPDPLDQVELLRARVRELTKRLRPDEQRVLMAAASPAITSISALAAALSDDDGATSRPTVYQHKRNIDRQLLKACADDFPTYNVTFWLAAVFLTDEKPAATQHDDDRGARMQAKAATWAQAVGLDKDVGLRVIDVHGLYEGLQAADQPQARVIEIDQLALDPLLPLRLQAMLDAQLLTFQHGPVRLIITDRTTTDVAQAYEHLKRILSELDAQHGTALSEHLSQLRTTMAPTGPISSAAELGRVLRTDGVPEPHTCVAIHPVLPSGDASAQRAFLTTWRGEQRAGGIVIALTPTTPMASSQHTANESKHAAEPVGQVTLSSLALAAWDRALAQEPAKRHNNENMAEIAARHGLQQIALQQEEAADDPLVGFTVQPLLTPTSEALSDFQERVLGSAG